MWPTGLGEWGATESLAAGVPPPLRVTEGIVISPVFEEGPPGPPQPRLESKRANCVASQKAEHHQAVEALQGGHHRAMWLWREHVVEPENMVTVTPQCPRERRFGSLRCPRPSSRPPPATVCGLSVQRKGAGFSIAGRKDSVSYWAANGASSAPASKWCCQLAGHSAGP